MKVIYSERFLEHQTFKNPESKDRLLAIAKYLKEKGISASDFIEPAPASEEDMLLVHDRALLDELKLRSSRLMSTPDNPFNENTYELALLSAGAALDAARLSESEFAFALSRPPGHHVGIRTFGGFCYLNNIAYAVRKYQEEKGIKRVLIIDFDVHLGQGTLEIFEKDKSVFYLSLHQLPETIYPWRDFGRIPETTRKVELEPGTTDREYIELFQVEAGRAVKQFKPELIAVSAGFDIFHSDSMVGSSLGIVKPETFFEIGGIIRGFNKQAFGVLEGGYTLETLGELAYNFLKAFK